MNKYRAIRTKEGFASKLEAAVFDILKIKEHAGEIRGIKHPARVNLTCGIFWNCDFSFYDKAKKKTAYAEAKGVETERYRIVKKLWRSHGPGALYIYKGHYTGPRLVEILVPEA